MLIVPIVTFDRHAPELTNEPWAHDLHASVVQDKPPTPQQGQHPNGAITHAGPPRLPHNPKHAPPNRTFSRSTQIGSIQIRVFIPHMKDPITFTAVPVQQHTRLPQHRPPLRRDKPVRISLPGSAPRYIFPSVERSFIFIPRALRPNQQGYGRGGSRTGFRSYRALPSSRQTSVYGWSVYSPSVSMSRRSSMAQEMASNRDFILSGSGSTGTKPLGAFIEPGKPVVRLPPAGDSSRRASQVSEFPRAGSAPQPAMLAHSTVSMPGPPLPRLTYAENHPAPLPMHQPRPQKAVSVAGIDSPETIPFPLPHYSSKSNLSISKSHARSTVRGRQTMLLSRPTREIHPTPVRPRWALHRPTSPSGPFTPSLSCRNPSPDHCRLRSSLVRRGRCRRPWCITRRRILAPPPRIPPPSRRRHPRRPLDPCTSRRRHTAPTRWRSPRRDGAGVGWTLGYRGPGE